MSAHEDSDLSLHSRGLIRIFTGRVLDRQGCKIATYSDSDQFLGIKHFRIYLGEGGADISEGTFSHVATQSCIVYFGG